MSLEKRIRDELHDTAERLALVPGEYRRAMERGATRRRQRLAMIVTGALALGVVVVAANAIELAGPVEPASDVATTLGPVPPVTSAPGSVETTAVPVMMADEIVAVASIDGLGVYSPGGETAFLTSDPYHQSISWAISDGEGGLVFTHEVTPLPWVQGTLMWLGAGASMPSPLVAPEGGGVITPLEVDQGSVFYRLDDLAGSSSIRAIGLDGSDSRVVVGPTPMLGSAAVSEGLLVLSLGGDCGGYALYDTAGTALPTPDWASECGPGVQNDIDLADGYLFTLSDIDSQRQLVRIDLETGEQASTPIIEGWQVEAEAASRVAYGGNIIRVGDFSGDEFVETESYSEGHGTFAFLPSIHLAANPRLGSGMGELPCTVLDVPNPEPTGLPAPVEEKFQQVFTLAKTCDLEALAEVVREDGAAFTYGGDEHPVQTWVRNARFGFDIMPMTVRILNTPPALVDGIYAWPGVFVTNSEEDWQQLSGILSAAEFDLMYKQRDDIGYLGLRVGITEDGRLSYLISGD